MTSMIKRSQTKKRKALNMTRKIPSMRNTMAKKRHKLRNRKLKRRKK